MAYTSDSGLKIKSKLSSAAFAKTGGIEEDSNFQTPRKGKQIEDTLKNDFHIRQSRVRGISPNMQVKATKTEKEEQLEKQI